MKHMFECDKIDTDKKHRMRKADIYFVSAISAVAFAVFLLIKLRSDKGSYAVISYDGEMQFTQILREQSEPMYYLLTYENSDDSNGNNTDSNDKSDMYSNSTLDKSSTLDNSITIQELSAKEWETIELPNTEYNVFICADNEICMLQSSCPDKICVNHSAISNTGENIICLPHKLVIEIKGGKENDLDGVAY